MGFDRYTIYEMMGRHVEADLPPFLGGHELKGEVTRVFRDVMEDRIEIAIRGMLYFVREPDAIAKGDAGVAFIYGDVDEVGDEEDDEIVFSRLLCGSPGAYIDRALRETSQEQLRTVVFEFSDA